MGERCENKLSKLNQNEIIKILGDATKNVLNDFSAIISSKN